MLTAVGFGLVPAWRARRLDAAEAVAHTSHSRTTRRGAVSGPLVVGQIALSLVLVVAAGLFGRTFSTLAVARHRLRAGRAAGRVRRRGRLTPERRARLYGELQQAAAAVPGVQAAAVSMIGPLSGMGWNSAAEVSGRAAQARPRCDDLSQRGDAALVRDLRHAADSPGATSRAATTPARRSRSSTRPSRATSSGRGRRSGSASATRPARARSTEVEIVGVVENAAYRGAARGVSADDVPAGGADRRSAAVPEPDGADGARRRARASSRR